MKDVIESINTSDGLFHDGDQSTGALGTIVTAKFQNDVQSSLQNTQNELISILKAANPAVLLDPTKTNQLLAALKLMFFQTGNYFSEISSAGSLAQSTALSNLGIASNLIPVGVPLPWPNATPPAGWVKCNGASFAAASYPKLAAIFPGLTLPDLRGEFIRGWDDGRGVDSNRELLSVQGHLFASHVHNVPAWDVWDSSVLTPNDKKGDALLSTDNASLNSGGTPNGMNNSKYATVASGSTETRPRNVAFNFIVRAM